MRFRRKLRPVETVQGLIDSAERFANKGGESLAIKRYREILSPDFKKRQPESFREVALDAEMMAYEEILSMLERRGRLGFKNLGTKIISKLSSMGVDNPEVLGLCGEYSILLGNFDASIDFYSGIFRMSDSRDDIEDYLQIATRRLGYSMISMAHQLFLEIENQKKQTLEAIGDDEQAKHRFLEALKGDKTIIDLTSRGLGYLERYIHLYGVNDIQSEEMFAHIKGYKLIENIKMSKQWMDYYKEFIDGDAIFKLGTFYHQFERFDDALECYNKVDLEKFSVRYGFGMWPQLLYNAANMNRPFFTQSEISNGDVRRLLIREVS